jgi:hypothetical protein
VTVAITSKPGGVVPQTTVSGVGWLAIRFTVTSDGVVTVGAVLGADELAGADELPGDGGPVGADELLGVGCVQETEKVAVFEDTAAGLSTTRVPDPVLLSEAAVTVAGAAGWAPGALKVSDRVGPLPVGSSQ